MVQRLSKTLVTSISGVKEGKEEQTEEGGEPHTMSPVFQELTTGAPDQAFLTGPER